MAKSQLQNGSHRLLDVPELNDLPLHLELQPDQRFTRGATEWDPPPVTARESAMLQVMNDMTEKLNWHLEVFDDEIVANWRQEALKTRLMSNRAWDWCLAELRDKAADFKTTGRILVLNIGSAVCKSDILVPTELKSEFKAGVEHLLAIRDIRKNSHRNAASTIPSSKRRQGAPRGRRGRGGRQTTCSRDVPSSSNHDVVAHVDPSLFPLVYGRTQVMIEGDGVDLDRCFNYYGRGRIAPEYDDDTLHARSADEREDSQAMSTFWAYEPREIKRFSCRFQRLPCEVKFTESSKIAIASYINNLHPVHFKSLYGTIEKLISAAIGPWNNVLVKGGRGRWPRRIETWGVQWKTKRGDWPSREVLFELEKDRNSEAFKLMVYRIREYLTWPEEYPAPIYQNYSFFKSPFESADWEDRGGGLNFAINFKWKRLRQWEHPEPGMSFTYHQWKAGQTGNYIFGPSFRVQQQVPVHEFYTVSLEETFEEQGLQVIVKLASIELTPEMPCYEAGSWKIDGMLNEHIVATAIYYYDVSNVKGACISFRQETMMEEGNLNYGENLSEALAAVFGISDVEGMEASLDDSGYYHTNQKLGSVATHEGRLLAWPNTLQHQVGSFELADKSKPGHQRFIVLSLVDPHYRICSTRNVPPQRHDWWAEEAIKGAGFLERGIPPEVVDMILRGTDDWPMGMEEAQALRLEMMAESEGNNL